MKRLEMIPIKTHIMANYFFVLIIICSTILLNTIGSTYNYDGREAVWEFNAVERRIDSFQESLDFSQQMITDFTDLVMNISPHISAASADDIKSQFDTIDKENAYSAQAMNDLQALLLSGSEKHLFTVLSDQYSKYINQQGIIKQLLYGSGDNSKNLDAYADLSGDYFTVSLRVRELRSEEASILEDKIRNQEETIQSRESTMRDIKIISSQAFMLIEVIWISVILRVLKKSQGLPVSWQSDM